MPSAASSNRRDFLTGKAARAVAERAGDHLADAITANSAGRPVPEAGDTVRLTTRAMACDFAVVLNPQPGDQVLAASAALDRIHRLEEQMSVYRDDSELSLLNRRAFSEAVPVEPKLFELLRQAARIVERTESGFDPTSGPLIALWRHCRDAGRIPTDAEIAAALERTGIHHVQFDDDRRTTRFDRTDVELNLGGIGKGYALDEAGALLSERGVDAWLMHGGRSSLLAKGDHAGQPGWPIGIRHPLFPHRRLATILLQNRGLSTSGSGVQSFRHGGKRYGHILDPRTGRPAETMLSVTVLAPTAAEADALSTAFYVLGVEKSREYCDNHQEVGAILIPPPGSGRTLVPVVCGLDESTLFFSETGTGGSD